MTVRNVTLNDAEILVEIYRPYVEKTAITYEYEVPSVSEFAGRIEAITKKYPYICAEENGEITGYAYAGVFKGRRAYDWSVETTVYVKQGKHRKGTGKALYQRLEEELNKIGIKNMYACVAVPEVCDEYLDFNSRDFHQHLGFEVCGKFTKCAKKFGRWYSMVWLEKFIGKHD